MLPIVSKKKNKEKKRSRDQTIGRDINTHCHINDMNKVDKFLVSKETVLLRGWKSETRIWFYQTS